MDLILYFNPYSFLYFSVPVFMYSSRISITHQIKILYLPKFKDFSTPTLPQKRLRFLLQTQRVQRHDLWVCMGIRELPLLYVICQLTPDSMASDSSLFVSKLHVLPQVAFIALSLKCLFYFWGLVEIPLHFLWLDAPNLPYGHHNMLTLVCWPL